MYSELVKISTLQEFIAYGKTLEVSHSTLFYQSTIRGTEDTIKVNSITILGRYHEYIKSVSRWLRLSDDEMNIYRFQPKRLSISLYNTTELWSIILRLNDMTTFLDFKRNLILVPPSSIFDIINEIFILDAKEIQKNKIENA